MIRGGPVVPVIISAVGARVKCRHDRREVLMILSRYNKRKLRLLIIPSLSGLAIGAGFSFLISPDPTVRTIVQGMICGLLIGLAAFYMEYFILDRIRRFTVYVIILSRTVIFSIVIFVAYTVSDILVFNVATLLDDIRNFLLPIFGMSMVSILVVMLFINVTRLLGQKSFIRLLIGKYHKPVMEKRIFMFIDVSSSTTIAEEIGDIKFHSFLNDFFFDATRPIVECKGEIYKYVGDEIIVTWDMGRGTRDSNCLECYFQIENAIARLSDKYMKKYGLSPRFSAGLHCGAVVIGEMGDYKREVAFLGDAVNTASRIQNECRYRSRRFIISDDLRRELPVGAVSAYDMESLGSFALRGKKREIELFSVTRRNAV
jgi:adenylate cyclase